MGENGAKMKKRVGRCRHAADFAVLFCGAVASNDDRVGGAFV
jgi:hypothetical protein